jgi:HK97 family phage major capsid protein
MSEGDESPAVERARFNIHAQKSTSDIYDIAGARAESRNDDEFLDTLNSNALRSVEAATFELGHSHDAKGQVERLLKSDHSGEVARRILATGSPTYQRAFAKTMVGKPLSSSEREALERTSMSTSASAGGYAVPYTLDPSVIHSSNLSVNPWRALCRQVTLTGSNTWQGVSSAGVTASYDTELQEVSDDSPTFAQPTATLRTARAFVQYSIEIDLDWASLQSEMAGLFSEAKDDLESTSFLTGSGTAPNPLGILETANTAGVGTAAFVFTAGTAAFVVGDVYKLENALGPRWRPRASIVANRATYNAIRQFDTAGGAQLYVNNLQLGQNATFPTPGNLNTHVLGYPAYEASAMSTTYATTGQLSMILGDFSRMVIVDGVGMNVEPINHLFNTTTNLPDGRRGLFAYWRNATAITAPLAFKILKVL